MAQERVVYLICDSDSRIKWRCIGNAYACRDDSINFRLDLFPGLTFNIRPPRTISEAREAQFGTVARGVPQEVE